MSIDIYELFKSLVVACIFQNRRALLGKVRRRTFSSCRLHKLAAQRSHNAIHRLRILWKRGFRKYRQVLDSIPLSLLRPHRGLRSCFRSPCHQHRCKRNAKNAGPESSHHRSSQQQARAAWLVQDNFGRQFRHLPNIILKKMSRSSMLL